MRLLVDSSVWIDFLNDHPSPEANEIDRLLGEDVALCTTGLVVTEVLQGLRRSGSFAEATKLFENLVLVEPTGVDVYLRAANLYANLRQLGKAVRSAIDCILVATAEANECWLLARDRDMSAILGSGLAPTVQAWPMPHG